MAFWVTALLFVFSLVLSEVLRPKLDNEQARPAALGDFRFPTATEGRAVPIIWGTVKLEGPNVVWYGDLEQRAIKKKVKTGLFSSDRITIGYRYFIGVQMGLCRGQIERLYRIWIGEKVAYSNGPGLASGAFSITDPEFFGGDELGNGGIIANLELFPGSETQSASTYLSPFQQQGGDTPAYRGTAHVVLEKGYIGTSTTVKPWAFEVSRFPLGPSGDTRAVNSGQDANPIFVVYEAMTNTEWGLGFSLLDFDAVGFNAAADTMVSEGNGFSMVLDREIELSELIEEVERQIDGVFFLDQASGKWTVKLARDDYNIASIPSLDNSTILRVDDFTRGTWDDTTNYVTVAFSDRSRDYFDTYAIAQDMANVRVQGTTNRAAPAYPGVKDAALANSICWRDLRSLSFPLARAELVVDRTLWDLQPTDVFKWTSPELGFTDLVMRVSRIDSGGLTDGEIKLSVVQDIFATQAATFGAPISTGWVAPDSTVGAIPALDSVVFEAPKAFIDRDTDPATTGLPFRVWAAARRQGDNAGEFDLRTRLGSAVYETERTIDDFMVIGELVAALSPNITDTSFDVDPDPDTQTEILSFLEDVDATVLGTDLTQLVLIDNELMLVKNAAVDGLNVELQTVYRGVLDTAPASHLAGSRVYLLSAGGGIGSRSWADGNAVDIKLVPRSVDGALAEASATVLGVTMATRHLRPYPPLGFTINGGTNWEAGPHTLEDNGGPALDGYALDIGFVRRDYTTAQENLANISGDAAPSNTTTKYRLRVFDISSGSTELYASAFNAGSAVVELNRTELLRYSGGSIPTDLRVDVETRHTVDSVDHDSLYAASHSFEIDTELSDDFNLGVLANLAVSNSWTAPVTGDYPFSIGTANTGGPIEARINGGSWATVIATSGTTGTLTGVTASDTIEVRANGLTLARSETFLRIGAPSSSANGFAIFTV